MEKQTTITWIAFHIYYEDLTGLLVKCIGPLLIEENLKSVERYFFIRYFDKGRHMRLRLQFSDCDETVLTYIKETIEKYLWANPSIRTKDSEEYYLNNTIIMAKYSPETLRYGGKYGIEIAEQLFMYSSELSIKFLRDNEVSVPQLSLFAYELHLILIHSFCDGDIKKMRKLCYLFFVYTFNNFNYNNTCNEANLEFAFHENKKGLLSYTHRIFQALEDENIKFENDLIDMWYNRINTIKDAFLIADSKGLIDYAKVINDDEYENSWPILISHMHMTNNRIGINNLMEIPVSYYLMRTCSML